MKAEGLPGDQLHILSQRLMRPDGRSTCCHQQL